MPSAELSLQSILTAGSPTPLPSVGARVYWDALPQNVVYPAVRLQRISTPRSQYRTLDGRAAYASPRMQVDAYALSRSQAITLGQAVYQLLEGFSGTVAGLQIDFISTEDEGGDLEEGVGPGGAPVYRQRLDFFFSHPE